MHTFAVFHQQQDNKADRVFISLIIKAHQWCRTGENTVCHFKGEKNVDGGRTLRINMETVIFFFQYAENQLVHWLNVATLTSGNKI